MTRKGALSRRRFLKMTTAGTVGCMVATKSAPAGDRVVGPNDTVCIGVIGCGRRGAQLLADLVERSRNGRRVRVAAVCDIWEPRKQRAKEISGADLHHHWEELVARADMDAVVIATPDHWHAPMAIAAMQAGKDVYCEQPMGLTVAEAKAFRDCAVETGRIVQIGTQQTSEGQWHTANDIIRAGKIGKVLWSQGSYSRNTAGAQVEVPGESVPDPDTLDWDAFLGHAQKRPFSPERYLGWRGYWDYSGGVATDLFYQKLAPLLLAIGPEFPERVAAAGGIYVDDGREAPDAFVMTAEYPSHHTIVLASSMANKQELPAVIRGQEATLYCEGDQVRAVAENEYKPAFRNRFRQANHAELPATSLPDHMTNWLDGVLTRKKCVCNEELGYRAMVPIGMAVEAYKGATTLSFDPSEEKVIPSPPRVLPRAAPGKTA